MRLKCYTAESMADAMATIREELGEGAIVVSTQRASDGGAVRVTAAVETEGDDIPLHGLPVAPTLLPYTDTIRDALRFHGVPDRLADLLAARTADSGLNDAVSICAKAIAEVFSFKPIGTGPLPRPVLLVGPPGTGKTTAAAKLAARSRLANTPTAVITADTIRPGAMDQLAASTRNLDLELNTARDAESLADQLNALGATPRAVFVDTPGLNPFSRDDMDFLSGLVRAADVDVMLVLNAGIDPMEAIDIAEAFADVGATRLLASRLDMARRLGGILAAADAGRLVFGDVSINSQVADGLFALSPEALAQLILPAEETPTYATPEPLGTEPFGEEV